MFKADKTTAIEFLTDFSCNQADKLTNEWRNFYAYLFAKFMDGKIKTKDGNSQNPTMTQPAYSDKWKRAVVKDTGDQLKVKGASH